MFSFSRPRIFEYTLAQIEAAADTVLRENYIDHPLSELVRLMEVAYNYGATIHDESFSTPEDIAAFTVFPKETAESGRAPIFRINACYPTAVQVEALAFEFGLWHLHRQTTVRYPARSLLYNTELSQQTLEQRDRTDALHFARYLTSTVSVEAIAA